MNNKDYYSVLGVDKNATPEQIKEKYREHIKNNHPDVVPEEQKENATKKMQEINEAYDVLSDTEKRKKYDMYGTVDNIPQDNPFSHFYRAAPPDGRDIYVKCHVTLEDLFNGAHKTIKYGKVEQCSACNGTGSKNKHIYTCSKCGGAGVEINKQSTPFGFINMQTTCNKCHGTGKEMPPTVDICDTCNGVGKYGKEYEISVDIPKAQYSRFIIPELGYDSDFGGKKGNLVIEPVLVDDKSYRLDVNNIRSDEHGNPIIDMYTTYDCKYSELVLGGKMSIDTLHGKITIKIPKNTKIGTKMKCKGKGMPIPNTNNYSDLFVELNMTVPKELSDEQIKAITELSKVGL